MFEHGDPILIRHTQNRREAEKDHPDQNWKTGLSKEQIDELLAEGQKDVEDVLLCGHNSWNGYGLILLTNWLALAKSNIKIYDFFNKNGIRKFQTADSRYLDEYKKKGYKIKLTDKRKLIKELEAAIKRVGKQIKIPSGLKKCPKCGEYKGKVMERDLPPAPTFHNLSPRGYETKNGRGYIEVWCLCQGILCSKCGKNRVHRPISNFYDPADGQVYHTPAMSSCLCDKCWTEIYSEKRRVVNQ